jgi:hypothetical protein
MLTAHNSTVTLPPTPSVSSPCSPAGHTPVTPNPTHFGLLSCACHTVSRTTYTDICCREAPLKNQSILSPPPPGLALVLHLHLQLTSCTCHGFVRSIRHVLLLPSPSPLHPPQYPLPSAAPSPCPHLHTSVSKEAPWAHNLWPSLTTATDQCIPLGYYLVASSPPPPARPSAATTHLPAHVQQMTMPFDHKQRTLCPHLIPAAHCATN